MARRWTISCGEATDSGTSSGDVSKAVSLLAVERALESMVPSAFVCCYKCAAHGRSGVAKMQLDGSGIEIQDALVSICMHPECTTRDGITRERPRMFPRAYVHTHRNSLLVRFTQLARSGRIFS